MRILFILNQLPYPPRNGVTIPTANIIAGLSKYSDISVLYIHDENEVVDQEAVERNRTYVDNLWLMRVRRISVRQRIANELSGEWFYHMGRTYDERMLGRIVAENTFDIVWVSDDRLLDVVAVVRRIFPSGVKVIAGINDSITAVLNHAIKQLFFRNSTAKQRLLVLIRWLRSLPGGRIEKRILQRYDLIVVQSAEDKAFIVSKSGKELNTKIVVVPNGVDAKLFEIPYNSDSKTLLFVGSLRGYSKIVEWLIDNVWPGVLKVHPDATLHIVGKGASVELLEKIRNTSKVTHTEFIENLEGIYRDVAISVAPIFKNYGLINKVVESMASGIPVVADTFSFNAIPNFINSRHGFIADNATDMIREICELLSSSQLRCSVGGQARALVEEYFDWGDRVAKIAQRMEVLMQGDGIENYR